MASLQSTRVGPPSSPAKKNGFDPWTLVSRALVRDRDIFFKRKFSGETQLPAQCDISKATCTQLGGNPGDSDHGQVGEEGPAELSTHLHPLNRESHRRAGSETFNLTSLKRNRKLDQ